MPRTTTTGRSKEAAGPPPDPLPSNIFDSLSVGCQVIGPDWKYLYLNTAAARQGRCKREDLLGRTMMACYPGFGKTPVFALFRRCMEDRTSQTFENEFHYPDGGTAWFELRIEPVPRGLFILSLEITERKRARKEWHRLSTAIERVAESVILTSATGEIQYVSPAFERIHRQLLTGTPP